MSAITAPRFQTVSGEPVLNTNLVSITAETEWGPLGQWGPIPAVIPGPFTVSEFREYLLADSDGVEPPEMDAEFHFTHEDLSPTNVILSGTEIPKSEDESHVHVASIIDWEAAGFYPKFWIALYLLHPNGAHWLSLDEEQCRTDVNLAMQYAVMVSRSLTKLGWPSGGEMFPWWRNFIKGKREVYLRLSAERNLAKAAEKLRVE